MGKGRRSGVISKSVEGPTESATIEQLAADAAKAGHSITIRTIRDWTELGLLDYPMRRSAGKGHGSQPALYSANQRNLLLSLLQHRPTNGIKSIARIPVAIWTYWGEDYVPTSQALRAMRTWLGDPRSSRKVAQDTAREVLLQIDNPGATSAARRELLTVLTDLAWTGTADDGRLDRAVRNVFEADAAGGSRRAVGHPTAPMVADSLIDLIKARLVAIDSLTCSRVTEAQMLLARHIHLVTYAEYAMAQPEYAAGAPPSHPSMYEPVTAQSTFNSVCANLLTVLGLSLLDPGRTAAVAAMPTPRIIFKTAAR